MMDVSEVGFVLSGPVQTEAGQFLQQKAALKLEVLGMRHSSGRSVYAHIKRVYGLKGNRKQVLAQMEALAERIIRHEVTAAELRAEGRRVAQRAAYAAERADMSAWLR